MRKQRHLLIWVALPVVLLCSVAGYEAGRDKARQGRQAPAHRQAATECAAEPMTGMGDGLLVAGDPAGKVIYSTPQWSPTGRAIAYVRSKRDAEVAKNGDLYLAEFSNGAWRHRLLVQGADWPRWSPDGTQLAFNQGALAVLDVPSGRIRKLVADDLGDGESYERHYPVRWSPDGRYLFYRVACWEWALCGCYDARQGTTHEWELDGADGVWTPDNRVLLAADPSAYEGGDEYLGIYDPTTQEMKRLVDKAVGLPTFVTADGAAAYLDDDKGISRLDLATGKLHKVLQLSASHLAWSPDGKRFAFLDWQDDGEGPPKAIALHVGSTADWRHRLVAPSVLFSPGALRDDQHTFSWSPDSTAIAYTTETGDIRIYRVSTP